MNLSPDQSKAHDAIVDWFRSRRSPLITLGGYAGTGKSTTLGAVTNTLKNVRSLEIAFCCYTGKASLVLREKLIAAKALGEDDYCGTIHALIYKAERQGRGVVWKKVPQREMRYDLIVVDEASMLGDDVFGDLKSYGIPILAVGDHGQLPPVSGTLNLMADPQIRLEKIHRQAEGSPIIHVSMLARLEGRIPVGVYGPGVLKTTDRSVLTRIRDPKAGIILCGTNATRVKLNSALRRRHGPPVAGERVVCLRNDREAHIYNGMLGEMVKFEDGCPAAGQTDPINGRPMCRKNCERHAYAEIDFDGMIWTGAVVRDQFGAPKTIDERERSKVGHILAGQFDFASAITTHKAQGSEWDNVIVVEETGWMDGDSRRRWLYTATTRSRSKLMVIGS